jgi:predicted glycogen debranching enzyme
MEPIIRRIDLRDAPRDPDALHYREWLVTNGLGGYASGTLSGVATRRYHGLLVSALPAPYGRTVTLCHLLEQFRLPDGKLIRITSDSGDTPEPAVPCVLEYPSEFWLEDGLPVWRYELGGVTLLKRIVMPHEQNTVHVRYELAGPAPVRLKLMPLMHFRPHEHPVSTPLPSPFRLSVEDDRYEFFPGDERPSLRVKLYGQRRAFTLEERTIEEILFSMEQRRGYEYHGGMWSPGYFRVDLGPMHPATLVASTEYWDTMLALHPDDVIAAEQARRKRLRKIAPPAAQSGLAAELVLAADQFLIRPAGRVEDAARAHAAGDELRSVIAGYHWFTDWGRDTMISLEGLTLSTGRTAEAGCILRSFAQYVRNGLLPNLFPEHDTDGLYHTADATLWFFQAIHRYILATDDRLTLQQLLPRLNDIVVHHIKGTDFGIGVDPADGLLRQGAPAYQLTWMDAKVGDWVVTPRRGKAVEINALWYNALLLLAEWLREEGQAGDADKLEQHAARARESFNRRFWFERGEYLLDVVDGENGDDDACRPNQLLAISLQHPILDRERWVPVLQTVRTKLLTPFGLRTLAPGHADYKAKYFGDLRSRDAAYHQGTVWGWLIGPYIDAWLAVFPDDTQLARQWLEDFAGHLNNACIGTISEIFDATEPYSPRGCIAQAWSVAEVLRCLVRTARAVS